MQLSSNHLGNLQFQHPSNWKPHLCVIAEPQKAPDRRLHEPSMSDPGAFPQEYRSNKSIKLQPFV